MPDEEETGSAAGEDTLTDNEGSLLAVVLRRQPITAYQIVRVYERSPASSFNESKGSVYPLVARLRKRGLIVSRGTDGDKRNAHMLTCSEAGRTAVRQWVLHFRPSHILLNDPLRSKVMSFGLLSRDEQIEWIMEMKEGVRRKIEQVEEFHRREPTPFNAAIYANAMGALRSRIDWLDQLVLLTASADSSDGQDPPAGS